MSKVTDDKLPFTEGGDPISVVADLGGGKYDIWAGYLEKSVSGVRKAITAGQTHVA